MIQNKNKGFTLIELLVVIAIIGILASVVLASLNTARAKGADAAVKANMSGIRSNAELQFDTMHGCYTNTDACSPTAPAVVNATGGDCPAIDDVSIFGFPAISAQITAAKTAGVGLVSCSATEGGTAWAAAAQYKSDPSKVWCVDNKGTSKEVTLADSTRESIDAEVAGGACQ